MKNVQFSVVSCRAYDGSDMAKSNWSRKNQLVTYYEFEFYTEDGSGGIELDGLFYPAVKGYCCMAKPGQHVSEILPRKCCYINIETQDTALCEAFDRLPSHFPLWNIDEVIGCLRKIIALGPEGGIDYQIRLQGYACRVITALLAYRQGDPNLPGVRQHEKLLIAVDKYMRENVAQDLQLADLAKFCNMDPTYFHKLFKAAVGRTPAKQLQHYRISAAKLALLDSRLRLEEIAQQCGFSSVSYFCSKFRQVTGLTPMQYRNRVIKTAGKK